MRQTYTGIRRFPERSIMICIIPDTSRHITLVINERRRENAILLPKPMHAAVSAPHAVMQEFKLKRAGCGTRHGRERRTTDLNTQLSVRILHPLNVRLLCSHSRVVEHPACMEGSQVELSLLTVSHQSIHTQAGANVIE